MEFGQGVKGALEKGLDAYNKLAERIGLAPERVPVEEIDQHRVAKIVVDYLWAGHMRFVGDKTNNPFSASDLLPNMGYAVFSATGDYRKRFPEEYNAVRKILDQLVRDEVLSMHQLPKPDMHNESVYYLVVNKPQFRALAVNPQIGLPARP